MLVALLAFLQPFGFTLAELGVIALAVVFAAEVAGFSRSTRTVRAQNADLRERNATLEGEVKAMKLKIGELETQVNLLKMRSVDALMEMQLDHDRRMTSLVEGQTSLLDHAAGAITSHEDRAVERHDRMLAALTKLVQKGGAQ